MSGELRKKSSSFSQSANPLKTVNKFQSKDSQLATCRSVSAFADMTHQNAKIQTNRKKQVEKFSIENGRHSSAKKHIEDSKSNQKGLSFIGYKQAIESRKKKGSTVKKNYTDELLSTIDAFQETLDLFPLEKLILSDSPFYWVEEQIKTFERLHLKFAKIQHTLQQETKLYYRLKFQSIANLIKNIKLNLDSLNMMALLKNYTSGCTSMQSRNSQSTSSLGQTSVFPTKGEEKHQRSRSHTEAGDKINQGRNYATDMQSSEGVSSRNYEDKQNMIRYSNLNDRKSQSKNFVKNDKRAFEKVEINERDQFILNEYKSSNSQSQDFVGEMQTLRSEKSFSEDEKAYMIQEKQKINQMISKEMENNHAYNENTSFSKNKNMNKTVSKYQNKMHQNAMQTRQNIRHFISIESKETFNTIQNDPYQQSLYDGDETKRRNILAADSNSIIVSEQLNALKRQLESKNQMIENLESRHQKSARAIREEFAKKEKHYLEAIYDLKQENKEKQNSIKHLLLEAEEISDQYALKIKQLKESCQINSKLAQKLSLLEQSAETLSNELRKSKTREDELRETVQLERQRTKKVQKQIEEIEVQLEEGKSNLKQMISDKRQFLEDKQKITKELQILKEEKEKIREKEQIYKLKYFRLYADFDKLKEKVNEDCEYWKKICLSCKKEYSNPQNTDPEKQAQLRQLISFHKKRLLSQ